MEKEIETIKELVEIVNDDNIDNVVRELSKYLALSLSAKELYLTLGGEKEDADSVVEPFVFRNKKYERNKN